MISARLFAGIELLWLTVLFLVAIWGPYLVGINGWTIAAFISFFVTVATSALLRRHNWKEAGLRFDNLTSPCARMVSIFTGALWVSVLVSKFIGAPIAPISGPLLFGRIASAIFQEVLFLGYFFHRWQSLLKRPFLAAAANALWFGLIHVPDPALVTVATFGGFLFNWLFVRMRNVFVLGLAHAALSIILLPVLTNHGVIKTAQIGPPALGSFADRLESEHKPGERIGICSRVLAPDQFGRRFDREIERVLRGIREEESSRDAIKRFFAAKERVFCVTTEAEWRRYPDRDFEKKLFVLADNYIWKDWRLIASRDERILGFFRDRVLLVSNQPSL